ncbi:MAG: hypothetical protein ACRDIY_11515, partial [Chloroflexota bacterium]
MDVVDGAPGSTELRTALMRLDLRLRVAVENLRAELAERADDPLRGLYISDSDVDALLEGVTGAQTGERLLDGSAGAIVGRLDRLAQLFGLDPFEQEAVLICLAPEVDLRYERLYAYLQDDVSRRRPIVNLLLRLLSTSLEARLDDRQVFGPAGRLFKSGVLVLADEAAANWPLLTRPLKLDERIVEYLVGSDELDPRVASFARLHLGEQDGQPAPIPAEVRGNLLRLLRATTATGAGSAIIYVHGPSGAAKRATIRDACLAAGRPFLLVDVDALVAHGKPVSALDLVGREALLQDAILGFDRFDRLLSDEPESSPIRLALRALLARRTGPTVLIGEARWEPSAWLPEVRGIRIEMPALALTARQQLWHDQIDGRLPVGEVADLAARFRLDQEAVRAVSATAELGAIWRGGDRVAPGDLRAAARAIAAPPLSGL